MLELVLDVYDMLVDKVDVLILLIHDKLSFLHVGIITDLVVVNLHYQCFVGFVYFAFQLLRPFLHLVQTSLL